MFIILELSFLLNLFRFISLSCGINLDNSFNSNHELSDKLNFLKLPTFKNKKNK